VDICLVNFRGKIIFIGYQKSPIQSGLDFMIEYGENINNIYNFFQTIDSHERVKYRYLVFIILAIIDSDLPEVT
jgi:hypothetical protein